MCWSSVNKPIKIVAERDIHVVKLLKHFNGNILSPFRFYKYKTGEIYNLNKELKIVLGLCNYNIHEGFHSYNSEIKFYITFTLHNLNIVNKFHDYVFTVDFDDSSCFFVDCIIPKGSIFYENDNGEVVSDSLMINEVLFDINDLRLLEKQGKLCKTYNKTYTAYEIKELLNKK